MEIEIVVRDLQPVDLDLLGWSGGEAHIAALEAAMQRSWAGEVAVLVLELPNGRLVGVGAADMAKEAGAGWLWMLSVDEAWQSLGLGTLLVRALEQRCREHGAGVAKLSVEHDNPRAAGLYRRLGYRGTRTMVETWPTDKGVTWVTTCLEMVRELAG